ncbi:NADPH-dependent FMN reductase [Snuella sedimenti]|uniref:NAD(P)H-dependent oxidoreductase n=1 Tax=Snuella sedimenti TaxID=2798802 RepID=A0A8J7LN98_9FLAO|nr:NADPH-dependent FMN reductase [Snuella sedimenti]MBJ6368529.1 NAD(P)H-dependent oxidoreductase [Snuella sedimenti]
MKKVIAFAGSNSKHSINKQLVTYASSLVENNEVSILDLNDFELPLFGVDLEAEIGGQPKNAHKFLSHIEMADGIIVSLAEHNGAYSTAFKNLLDWMSRIEGKTFYGKPMLLMATSPGARGGKSVLGMAQDRFPRHTANITGAFSLPSFNANFTNGKINDPELNAVLKEEIKSFQEAL